MHASHSTRLRASLEDARRKSDKAGSEGLFLLRPSEATAGSVPVVSIASHLSGISDASETTSQRHSLAQVSAVNMPTLNRDFLQHGSDTHADLAAIRRSKPLIDTSDEFFQALLRSKAQRDSEAAMKQLNHQSSTSSMSSSAKVAPYRYSLSNRPSGRASLPQLDIKHRRSITYPPPDALPELGINLAQDTQSSNRVNVRHSLYQISQHRQSLRNPSMPSIMEMGDKAHPLEQLSRSEIYPPHYDIDVTNAIPLLQVRDDVVVDV